MSLAFSKSSTLALSFAWSMSMVANVLSWLFNIYLNHTLNLNEFSQITVILNSLVICSMLALAFQLSLTKFLPVVFRSTSNKLTYFSSTAAGMAILLGLICTLIAYGTRFWWLTYLHLPVTPIITTFLPLALLGIWMGAFARGMLYGARWYYLVGSVIVTENIVRLGFGLLTGPLLGSTYSAALVGIVVSLLLPYLITACLLFRPFKISFHFDLSWVSQISRFAFISLCLTIGAQLLLFTDLLMVKHYFAAEVAGVYATVSLIGKMIFFLTTSMVTLLAPEVAVRHAYQSNSRHLLFKAIAFTFISGLGSTLMFALVPHYSLDLFLDPYKVSLAVPLVFRYGLAVTLISLMVVLSTYFAFRGYRWFVFVNLVGLFCQLKLMSLYHPSLVAIISIMLLVALFSLVTMLLLIFLERRYVKKISASPDLNVPAF